MDTDQDFEFEPEEQPPTAARGLVVTKSKLAEITGFAPITIDKHVAAGAPVIAKGTRKQGWQIDTAAYIGWVIRTKVKDATGDPEAASFEVEKRLDKKAQRRLRELEIAERERALIPVDDVVKWAGEKYGVVRSRSFAMQSQLPGLTTINGSYCIWRLLTRSRTCLATTPKPNRSTKRI